LPAQAGYTDSANARETIAHGWAADERAVWLALEPHPVLAFLYTPEADAQQLGGTAVLFCPAFGWEEMCAYRGRRAWAQALAQAGFPSATFSLPGSADSGGSPRDTSLLDAWTASVSGAARWLTGATGATRVAAVGIGLGGMLACRALAAGAPIDDLVLWGVPAAASTWLRELRAHARIIGSRHPEDHRPEVDPEGEHEYTGFLLSAETAADLEALRLTELDLPRRSDRRVLLLSRDGSAPDGSLQERLERSGASVTVQASDEYRALMLHPQEAQVPVQAIATTIGWLGSEAPPAVRRRRITSERGRALERDCIELIWEGGTVRETLLRVEGPSGTMFGVLSEGAEDGPASVGMVWIGAGALRHTGPNRVWVETARRWAARGVPTVRVDLDGLGDSEGPEGPVATDDLYTPSRLRETIAVLDHLSAHGVADRFVLGGLCSGAYLSLHAALDDDRVRGLMLLNLNAFFWTDALTAERETHSSMTALRGRGWRGLAQRGVSFERMRTVASSLRPARLRAGAGRPVERSQSADIEQALDQLRARGTGTLLMFSRGEALLDQLGRQGVLDRLGRWPNLTVETIPSSNHMFRALWLQRVVHKSLDRALERVLVAARDESRTGS
jgi:alpha-beta hydrolase superfamily lysophospholipase